MTLISETINIPNCDFNSLCRLCDGSKNESCEDFHKFQFLAEKIFLNFDYITHYIYETSKSSHIPRSADAIYKNNNIIFVEIKNKKSLRNITPKSIFEKLVDSAYTLYYFKPYFGNIAMRAFILAVSSVKTPDTSVLKNKMRNYMLAKGLCGGYVNIDKEYINNNSPFVLYGNPKLNNDFTARVSFKIIDCKNFTADYFNAVLL
ncbi:MAG: hypothetical protein LBT79_00910 [Elusimicrobiota bacterium]|jgi:hypothetical protein|nr:hypothetical protein [Elusimicrobiota bacterium]